MKRYRQGSHEASPVSSSITITFSMPFTSKRSRYAPWPRDCALYCACSASCERLYGQE